MTKITSADINAGRRRLKSLTDDCQARAGQIRAERENEAEHLRDLMRFHYGLKTKNLDSVVLAKTGEGWVSLLILKDAPRGMPNVIAAPDKAETEEAALENAKGLLDAAWVMILDYKAEMAAGVADKLRRFEAGPLALAVPWEVLNIIGNQIPEKTDVKQQDQIRAAALARIATLTGEGTLTNAGFEDLDDEAQLNLMVEAAKALCVNCNTYVPA